MIVYKSLYASYPSYFVRIGKAYTRKGEATASKGYHIFKLDGLWNCKTAKYYDRDLGTEKMPIVAKTRHNLQSLINDAIIYAVLDVISMKGNYPFEDI